MDIKLITTVTLLHFFALVSPGPDFVLTVRNSLQFGGKHGTITGLGFGAGIAIHVTYCIAGIALVMKNYPVLFQGIKAAGALYLIYIGFTVLKDISGTSRTGLEFESSSGAQQAQTFVKSFSQGLMTNLLNPKATLFVLGLFSSVIPPQASSLTLITSGTSMVILTVLWFAVVSILFGSQPIRAGYLRLEKGLNMTFGLFFILTGAALLISRH